MADPVLLSWLDQLVLLVASLPWGGGGAIADYFFFRQTRPLHTRRFFFVKTVFSKDN